MNGIRGLTEPYTVCIPFEKKSGFQTVWSVITQQNTPLVKGYYAMHTVWCQKKAKFIRKRYGAKNHSKFYSQSGSYLC